MVPWLFFCAQAGAMVGGTICGTYLIFYITESIGIAAAAMGVILMVSRIGDLILGIFAGTICAKFQFKPGQYRFWLLASPIIVATGTTMLFINFPIPTAGKYLIIFIGYMFYGGGMSFLQLGQNGMLSKVAGSDMGTRITISGRLVQGQYFGTILMSMIAYPLISWGLSKGFDGYSVFQAIFAALGACIQLILFFGTKNYEEWDPDYKQHGVGSVKLGTMFKESLSNPQLLLLFLSDCIRWTALMGVMSMGTYYLTYVIGNLGYITLAMTLSSVLGLIFGFIAPSVAKRIGKRTSAICAGIGGGTCYILLGLFAKDSIVLYICFTSLALVFQSLINSVGVNLYLDCGEYVLYESGNDVRTFTMSIFGIGAKVGLALSSLIVSFVLAQGGYVAADPVSGTVASVADRFALGRFVGLVPGALMVTYGLLMIFYKITDEKAREYAEHNAQAAQQRA